MGLLVEKIIGILSIFVETAIFVLFPILNAKFKGNLTLMGLANSFSAGLFLAAGLFHILPDSVEVFEKATKENGRGEDEDSFPWPYLCLVLSFSLVFLVDKVLLNSHEMMHGHGHSHQEEQEGKHHVNLPIKQDYTDDTNSVSRKQDQKDTMEQGLIGEVDNQDKLTQSGVSAYILVVAMGIHSCFSGLALGINNDRTQYYGILIAILVHKWAEALTVGVSFAKSGFTRKKTYVLIGIFTMCTPLGAIAGLFLSGASKMMQAVLLAVSAGTFVYIACVEVITEEFNGPGKKFYKYLCFLLGVSFMVFVWFVEQWTGSD